MYKWKAEEILKCMNNQSGKGDTIKFYYFEEDEDYVMAIESR